MEGHYSEAINRKYKNSQGAQQGVMQILNNKKSPMCVETKISCRIIIVANRIERNTFKPCATIGQHQNGDRFDEGFGLSRNLGLAVRVYKLGTP